MKTINIAAKFSQFTEFYQPRILGEVNDSYVKAVKLKGAFVWHHHDHEDEMFLVVKGTLQDAIPESRRVVRPGEFIIVPRGVEHLPSAEEETHILLFEPKTTLNTGNIISERTVANLEKV